MNAYDEIMEHAKEFKRVGYKIEKPEEKKTMAVIAPASNCKSAGAILANDNHPRRMPAYVPPAAARTCVTELLDPSDVDDLFSIGEHKDGRLFLKFTSVPRTVFVFSGVPAETIQRLRQSLSRDEFFAANIKDRPEYPVEVVTAPAKK